MGVVIVAGALANKPHNGGGAWERLSWATGLRRLGCDVYFVEQIDVSPSGAMAPQGRGHGTRTLAPSVNHDWFRSVTAWFGLADRTALVDVHGGECLGMSWSRL